MGDRKQGPGGRGTGGAEITAAVPFFRPFF